MKNYRKLFALLMTVVMLLGMVPAAHAEVIQCDHNWAWRWPDGQPANCQEWKWSETYCTKCGVGDGGFEQCGPHSWHEEIIEEPWCDVGGMKAMICSVCGEWQNNGTPLNPRGHNWGSWSWAHGSAPSCTEGAWQVRECKRCGQMEDRYVQGSNHKFGEWITTVEPTCTERGRHHHKCTVCGYSEWEPMPTVDHVFGDWRVIEEPQVGIPGTERRACIYGCGTHEDREIPPLEEALSADGLELTLVLSSTPANGTHFVVGEKVTFTETWVNNTGKTLFPFSVSIWTCDTPVFGSEIDQMGSWFAEDAGGPVAPGTSGSHSLTVTVTEADVARGAIYATAEILSTVHNGPDLENVTTPFVTAPCGKNLRFTKYLWNTPANGEFFVPGEVLEFWLSFNQVDFDGTTPPDKIIYDLRIYDPLTHGQNTVFTFYKAYSPGLSVYYTVTEEDAQRGYVENTAYVTFSSTEGGDTVRMDSNTVTVPCGPGELPDDYQAPGSVKLTLTEWGSPDNGTHYVPGERIYVFHELYNNSRDVTMTVDHQHFIKICGDGITENDLVLNLVVLPGTSCGTNLWAPTVTEADAARGYVERTTTFYLRGDDGNEYTATGSIRLPCGPGELPDDYVPPVNPDIDEDGIPNEEDPDVDGDGIPNEGDPVNSDGVRLEKELRNAPANGEFYVPGEVLNYALTLRLDDGLLLDDAAIYDPIAGGDGLVISYGKGLYGSMGMDVFYIVTLEDAQRGYVENTAYATWIYQDSGEAGGCESETVIAICGSGELPPDYEAPALLEITTIETTTPANGACYAEGETVILVDHFTNLSTTMNLTGSDWVNVEILGKGIFNSNADFGEDAVLAPGETKALLTSTYVITAEDAAQGYIQKTVHAGFVGDDGRFYTGSFEIRIPCGPAAEGDESVDADPIAVVKGILNNPANPEGFMFGEVIEFTVAVTNNLPDTVQHINLVDPLIPGWNYDIYALEPGATASTTVSYTVNIVDCFNGSVENYVSGRAVVADGYRLLRSNTVSADCKEVTILDIHPTDDPFGILFGLEVTKEVESLPLNGLYYTQGETVAYRITYVNGGEIPLTDVMIYDALAGIDEIASAEKLEPGESRSCFFNYTVTAGDVARGYIANTAVGQYIVNGYLNAVYSDAVVVDTDGQPDPESPEGAIDAGKLNSPAYCFRSSSSRTNVAYSWGTSFCINHEGVQGSILMMEKAAATPEVKLQVANYAIALWRAEVEKLYQELLGAADPQARAVIMAEYVAFLTHASNYETLLKVRCPDQPALVAQKLADLWEEKCITLCFEMHAPVSARQDSFLSVEVATMEGISDACTCVTYVEDKGWNGIEQTYCPAHSFPFAMIDMLLNGQDTAEAWTTVRQIWQVELRGGYNKVITLLGDRSDVALAEYATLENWMIAREAELTLLYPDNPELVAQTMVRIIIDQVNALCQLAQ